VGMLDCVESDASLSNQQAPFPTLADWEPEYHKMVKAPPTGLEPDRAIQSDDWRAARLPCRVPQAREPDRSMQSDEWRANVMVLHRRGKTAA
jgi:hypothetical protein